MCLLLREFKVDSEGFGDSFENTKLIGHGYVYGVVDDLHWLGLRIQLALWASGSNLLFSTLILTMMMPTHCVLCSDRY